MNSVDKTLALSKAFGRLVAGTSVTCVTMWFGCPGVTVHILMKRYYQTGNKIDAHRSERLNAATPKQDILIALTHIRQRL